MLHEKYSAIAATCKSQFGMEPPYEQARLSLIHPTDILRMTCFHCLNENRFHLFYMRHPYSQRRPKPYCLLSAGSDHDSILLCDIDNTVADFAVDSVNRTHRPLAPRPTEHRWISFLYFMKTP